MRCQNGFVAIVTLALAAILVLGTAYTSKFPQAAQAESVGFDALAHDLFGATTQRLGQADQS